MLQYRCPVELVHAPERWRQECPTQGGPTVPFHETADGITLSGIGTELLRFSTWDQVATYVDTIDGLPIEANQQVDLPQDPIIEAQLLDALKPSLELEDDLWSLAEELNSDIPHRWEWEPVDSGIVVNGRTWGWFATETRLQLLPLDFHNRATIAETALWQYQSMTGAVIISGIRQDGPIGLEYYWDDDNDQRLLRVTYNNFDPIQATSNALSIVLKDFSEPFCIACDDLGWQITIEISDEIPSDVVATALAIVWRPCPTHAADPDGWHVDMADRQWQWHGDRWVVKS